MTYVISERAAEDIYWLYESGKQRFGEWTANSYQVVLGDAIEFAAAHPNASPVRDLASGAVRVKYFGSHVIVYEVDDPDVVVLRIFH